jgi:hypothetical protein
LHQSLLFRRDFRSEKRREDRDIQKHREVVVNEREREREHIEADAGADTETTANMRKKKNKRKKNKRAIETHTWIRGPRRGRFLHRLETQLQPQPLLEHPRTSR